MDTIPLSALQHWLYCPRQCALIHNEQVWAENRFNAEGQLLHKKANEGPDEHRAAGSILRALHVSSEKLGLTGICDIVEFRNFKFQISMKYERFEDLPVWNDAIRLAEGCEDFLIAAKEHITYSKRDQLDRCSLSVSNNIAEGFERGSTNELIAYLYIARGSAGEVRSMLCFFERRPALRDFKSQISDLKSLAESCSRQLRGWADSLQNSEIKGPHHLNEKSRDDWQKSTAAKKGAEAFAAKEREMIAKLDPTHPARIEWHRRNGPL